MFWLSLIFGNFGQKFKFKFTYIFGEKKKYQEAFKKVFLVLGLSQNEASDIYYNSKMLSKRKKWLSSFH